MKNSTTLLAAALVATFTTTAADAGTRMISSGRAGYYVVSESPYRSTERYNGRTTNVALVMAKPDGTATKIQNSGRAGYMITRTPARDR